MKKLNQEGRGFFRGIIYSAGFILRATGDTVTAKEMIQTLGGDIYTACKLSCEFDVEIIRYFLIPDAPFGQDAEYSDFKGVWFDFDDNETTDPSDIYTYAIKAFKPSENDTVYISKFNNESDYLDFLAYAKKWEKSKNKRNANRR